MYHLALFSHPGYHTQLAPFSVPDMLFIYATDDMGLATVLSWQRGELEKALTGGQLTGSSIATSQAGGAVGTREAQRLTRACYGFLEGLVTLEDEGVVPFKVEVSTKSNSSLSLIRELEASYPFKANESSP